MNLAPLPARTLEMSIDRRLQSPVVVARYQSYAAQAARFEIPKQLVVRRFALGVRRRDREDFPMPVRADTGDDEFPLADELPTLPDMFIAGIDAQIRIGCLGQRAV